MKPSFASYTEQSKLEVCVCVCVGGESQNEAAKVGTLAYFNDCK